MSAWVRSLILTGCWLGLALNFSAGTSVADLIPEARTAIDMSRVYPAVARRDDLADSVLITAAASYPSVGRITFGSLSGSGVLIAPNQVLTAGHVVSAGAANQIVFTINGQSYTGLSKTLSPTWTNFNDSIGKGDDIAILTLSSNVSGITPSLLYTGSDEVGHVGANVGFGYSGTGTNGQGGIVGTRRAGDNTIDTLGTFYDGVSDKVLLQDFDNPLSAAASVFGSTSALAHESLATQGDSGGGLFVDFGSGALLVGITSFLFDANADTKLANYGDVSGTTRVSSNIGFINSVIGVPEPSSFVLMGLGILAIGFAGRRASNRQAV